MITKVDEEEEEGEENDDKVHNGVLLDKLV